MSDRFDAIVVGAGVMGASSAMQLAGAGMRRLLVLEKGPGPASGSTGRSTAIIRQTYSNFEVSLMAYEALHLFRHWSDFVGRDEERAHFQGCGVLFLFRPDEPSLPHIQALHRKVGIRSSLLDSQEAAGRFPDLDFRAPLPERVAAGGQEPYPVQALLEHEGGFADPAGTAQDLLDAARALGAEVRFRARVTGIQQAGGRVAGVTVAGQGGEERIATPVVVNCAGPWAERVNALAGQPLPCRLAPTRIQAVTKGFTQRLKGPLPVMADMVTGFYGRLEAGGGNLILGSVREEDEREEVADPDHYNEVADAPFRERILTLFGHRVPALATRGRVGSYAGLYTVNRMDSHPVIDASPLEGFYYVNGFSGHGFKLSPVVGMIVAQKVTGQWGWGRTAVPLHFFNKDREPLATHWGGVIA
jgi:sarcosine oxidase subunit beta